MGRRGQTATAYAETVSSSQLRTCIREFTTAALRGSVAAALPHHQRRTASVPLATTQRRAAAAEQGARSVSGADAAQHRGDAAADAAAWTHPLRRWCLQSVPQRETQSNADGQTEGCDAVCGLFLIVRGIDVVVLEVGLQTF